MRVILCLSLLLVCIKGLPQAKPLETTPLPEATSPTTDSIQLLKQDDLADEKNGLKSAALPGWGQIENKQYTKAGLFFAGVAGGVYTTLQFRKDFKVYDDAYQVRLQTFDNPEDEFAGILTLDELYDNRQSERSKKDIATGATAYIYIVNIVDAALQYKLIREEPGKHSATRAAYYSAILPGLGQAYNKKYWKIPIVYGAIGTSAYFAINNRNYHRDYQRELEYRAVGETTGFRGALTDEKLQEGLDYWRKWRDFAYITTGVVYFLNIVDATVDAHLYDFNVDEDLSFRPSPVIDQINGDFYYGVQFTVDLAKNN